VDAVLVLLDVTGLLAASPLGVEMRHHVPLSGGVALGAGPGELGLERGEVGVDVGHLLPRRNACGHSAHDVDSHRTASCRLPPMQSMQNRRMAAWRDTRARS